MSNLQSKVSIISPQRRQLLKLGILSGASSAVALAIGSAIQPSDPIRALAAQAGIALTTR